MRSRRSPVCLLARPPVPGEGDNVTDAPYSIFNIGCGRQVELLDYVRALEAAFGREAELQLLPMQPGDMAATMADVSRLERVTGYRPSTTVEEGVRRFVDWYVAHYGVAPS
jgi:UDP-glucuronate 4-epimerase